MSNMKELFSPERDAFKDLLIAKARANLDNKNILIEMGADWCDCCHRLDEFITARPELNLLRSHRFVHVRVFVGESEDNYAKILDILPPFDEIPYFFVFSADGRLLHVQSTAPLEEGQSYNYEKVWEFLSLWGDKKSRRILH